MANKISFIARTSVHIIFISSYFFVVVFLSLLYYLVYKISNFRKNKILNQYLIFSLDLDKKTFDLEIYSDLCTTLGHYDVKGRILVLPIVGNGKANITFGEYVTKSFYMCSLQKSILKIKITNFTSLSKTYWDYVIFVRSKH